MVSEINSGLICKKQDENGTKFRDEHVSIK